MNWLDSLESWGGVIVIVRIVASAVIAYCAGYLMGQSSGYSDGIRDIKCERSKISDAMFQKKLDETVRKSGIYLVK